jgi:hypothetical protein
VSRDEYFLKAYNYYKFLVSFLAEKKNQTWALVILNILPQTLFKDINRRGDFDTETAYRLGSLLFCKIIPEAACDK